MKESYEYPNPNKINIGDIVRVKSGSRKMCVVWIDELDEIGEAHCQFFMSGIGVGVVPKIFSVRVNVAALKRCWLQCL